MVSVIVAGSTLVCMVIWPLFNAFTSLHLGVILKLHGSHTLGNAMFIQPIVFEWHVQGKNWTDEKLH